jgi:hypothetical protein
MSCPPRVHSITCKWVYKVKTYSGGSLERYKIHLVASDFQQEHDHDYDETFAPVAHMPIIRTFLIVTSVREWSISQLDVKNAFLMMSYVMMFTCVHQLSILSLSV